jgi:hypothetical protein
MAASMSDILVTSGAERPAQMQPDQGAKQMRHRMNRAVLRTIKQSHQM